MRVALIHEALLPVKAYGGTERAVWWLSKALAQRGVDVTLVALPGTQCPWARVQTPDFRKPLAPQLRDFDVLHFFNTPSEAHETPHVVTIEGNGSPGETFSRNTIFVSRNHALRHAAQAFVYNGIDPDDYVFESVKEGSLLFLAKASWRVKNVKGAIRIARRARRPLHILGGSRWFANGFRGIHWHGMLGGKEKAQFIARASALLFPVLWNEPFGIAVIEALVSGTPVFASPLGSLPELIVPEVGALCRDDDEYARAIENLGAFRAEDCRQWALENFSYGKMGEAYITHYEKVLRGEFLNAGVPFTREALDALDQLPLRVGAGTPAAQPV